MLFCSNELLLFKLNGKGGNSKLGIFKIPDDLGLDFIVESLLNVVLDEGADKGAVNSVF